MPRWSRDACFVLMVIGGLILAEAVTNAQGRYAGRPLEVVLRELQSAGLRIVFSSEIVSPGLRVLVEPRASRLRDVLDELLKPHHLKAEDSPGGAIKIVRAKPSDPSQKPVRHAEMPVGASGRDTDPSRKVSTYSERVTVTEPWTDRREAASGSEMIVGRSDLQALASAGAADDPMRAVQAMPFAASGDDFRNELSVRGSPYRHTAIAVDGVATPWLQHALRGIGDAVSLGMIDSLVMEEATLHVGVYPRRYGDSLGAQVDFTLREGSRAGRQWRGAIGSTNATVVGEGPLGRAQRGSWLAAFRQSYREWPNTLTGDFAGKAFGFSDAQAKLVFDATPRQQVSFTSVLGRSIVDERGPAGPSELGVATNYATMVNVGWRSIFAPNTVATQRLSVVTHNFEDTTQASRDMARGSDLQLAYRAHATHEVRSGMFDGGIEVERQHSTLFAGQQPDPFLRLLPDLQPGEALAGSSWRRSGYVHVKWTPTSRLTLAPGVRLADSTRLGRRALSRWMLSEWAIGQGWTLNGSAGVTYQFPGIEEALAGGRQGELKPERAAELDGGIEQRLGANRWRVTVFERDERDLLKEPDASPRIVGDVLRDDLGPTQYANALTGAAHGVEFLFQHSARKGVSGWAAYAYGRTRVADPLQGEVYWADFDQRHGFNASGIYRFSDRTIAALKFRSGSNFPIPGYLVRRGGELFAGDRRNTVRLPAYARLDIRASHAFYYAAHRVTLFADVVNVLNRTNTGLANGSIDPVTGRATELTRTLFPRLPSVGILVEF